MKSSTKKVAAAVLAGAVSLGCIVGGSLAWLTARTEPVENIFTIGNIAIDLAETTEDYKMVPGCSIAKDPTVTVKADSEACWLFIRAEKSADFDSFLEFEVADGWTALSGENGVFYRLVSQKTAAQVFPVLKDNAVSVKDTVTKTMLDGLTSGNYPTLTFTAYAVQHAKGGDTFTPADAWALVKAS